MKSHKIQKNKTPKIKTRVLIAQHKGVTCGSNSSGQPEWGSTENRFLGALEKNIRIKLSSLIECNTFKTTLIVLHAIGSKDFEF